jgi:aconitate hydratase
MLGAKAVLAASFERIHRSNLIGMGVLPLRLPKGWVASTLRIAPGDTIEIDLDPVALVPRAIVIVRLRRHTTGEVIAGQAVALLDTAKDVDLIRAGGIIPMILRKALG